MRKFPKLTHHVEVVLRDNEATRNSDIDLTLWVWYTFYKEHLEWQETVGSERLGEGRWIVSLTSVRALPSEDKISRIRRKFQERSEQYPDGRYLATDPVVLARRRQEEKIRTNINTPHWTETI